MVEAEKSKYAIARLIAARALQIAMGSPIFIKISEEELEKTNYDPVLIALLEYKKGALPLYVKFKRS